MMRLTAMAATMLSGTPELWPSPCPGAPSTIGARYATPGFCDACGIPSMSEPSAMTGLPDPNRAVHAVGIPATPRSLFLEDGGQVALGLELLEPQLAEAEDGVDHLLRQRRHGVDSRRGFLLVISELRRQRSAGSSPGAWILCGGHCAHRGQDDERD
jgi:hypothetical protein